MAASEQCQRPCWAETRVSQATLWQQKLHQASGQRFQWWWLQRAPSLMGSQSPSAGAAPPL